MLIQIINIFTDAVKVETISMMHEFKFKPFSERTPIPTALAPSSSLAAELTIANLKSDFCRSSITR